MGSFEWIGMTSVELAQEVGWFASIGMSFVDKLVGFVWIQMKFVGLEQEYQFVWIEMRSLGFELMRCVAVEREIGVELGLEF